ncbi:hypothetical protein M595_2532 [Lyngbya aestuarii BL J]|uniref:Uncharacterized protein n=1 Tax=Lyngbya aestuarii BL J TaxID=1348334 RepID=U7QJM1_9CYAN|nr:hypothetical protein [Lyngbya aestuarii]ERT07442.1 hypothetical protein M595_2532 [Lyngbya aestuarii BL J]
MLFCKLFDPISSTYTDFIGDLSLKQAVTSIFRCSRFSDPTHDYSGKTVSVILEEKHFNSCIVERNRQEFR